VLRGSWPGLALSQLPGQQPRPPRSHVPLACSEQVFVPQPHRCGGGTEFLAWSSPLTTWDSAGQGLCRA
jgi:hypothetical protein